jgi:pyruvate ferredoxin oxidoreductase beta subunit
MGEEKLFAAGHTACAACGQAIAAKIVIETAGKKTIIANATGCLEVFSTYFPHTSWGVPWIHSLFENAPAVASGIEAALKHLGKKDQINVISQGGDGASADIGFGALSGMLERGHDILYVAYDNEAYMNTGAQRSGLTPFNANTTTSPPGKESFGNITQKKNMTEITAAHGIPYAATASVGYPQDIKKKVKKALSLKGPKYLQIYVTCPLGWRSKPEDTLKVAKLVVETGLFPLVEYENGKFTKAMPIKEVKPVEEFLKLQGRFNHLFKTDEGRKEIEKIQRIADKNLEKYGLNKDKG